MKYRILLIVLLGALLLTGAFAISAQDNVTVLVAIGGNDGHEAEFVGDANDFVHIFPLQWFSAREKNGRRFWVAFAEEV